MTAEAPAETSSEVAIVNGDTPTSPKPLRDERGRLLPGQPPLNPNGRPKKGSTVADKLRALNATTNASVAAAIVKGAKSGDSKHARIILEYQTGLPQRSGAASLDEGSPFAQLVAALGPLLAAAQAPAVEGEYRDVTEDEAGE